MTDGAQTTTGPGAAPSAVGVRALADLCLQAGVEEIEAAIGSWSVQLKLDLTTARSSQQRSTESAQEVVEGPHVLLSQWVGVFHRAAESGSPYCADEGQEVEAGEIVGVVAAMQLQHEVLADRTGVLRRFLVQDRTAVEYGQPLLEIV
jgi:acetyl-CoA carboxylase biotin carboxyl carrier protein